MHHGSTDLLPTVFSHTSAFIKPYHTRYNCAIRTSALRTCFILFSFIFYIHCLANIVFVHFICTMICRSYLRIILRNVLMSACIDNGALRGRSKLTKWLWRRQLIRYILARGTRTPDFKPHIEINIFTCGTHIYLAIEYIFPAFNYLHIRLVFVVKMTMSVCCDFSVENYQFVQFVRCPLPTFSVSVLFSTKDSMVYEKRSTRQ